MATRYGIYLLQGQYHFFLSLVKLQAGCFVGLIIIDKLKETDIPFLEIQVHAFDNQGEILLQSIVRGTIKLNRLFQSAIAGE